MASKVLILLGLIAFLFVVSEMAAAGTVNSESEETVQPDGYGGYGRGGYNKGGGGYNRGGGYNKGGGYNRGGRGGGSKYCRHGCCYKGYSGCSRCCSYAGEAVQTQPGN